VDSNRTAAKAALCKIPLRITATLTSRFAAKSAPQLAERDTKCGALFSARRKVHFARKLPETDFVWQLAGLSGQV